MLHRMILTAILAVSAAQAQSLDSRIEKELPALVSAYKMLHAAPELSHREEKTAAYVAKELKALGYTVTDHLGHYENPDWVSYGVAAVLKNGSGPTILVRSELDALPLEEKTGLDYASKVKTKNDAGLDVGVMHACGHDLHIASLIGTAKMLVQLKDQWHGTLIFIAQPAEEIVSGARAMFKDSLYTKIPVPDYALALHCAPFEAGKVGYCPGFTLASATSVDITVRGIGGHGARPETAKDPIVVASEIVVALQTIISRENSPLDPAVVTVGSIHGGTKHNIIPDEVKLQITVRAYKEDVRQRILAAIARISKGIAIAAGIPDELAPIVKVSELEFVTPTYNDPDLTKRLVGVFNKALGAANVVEQPPKMGAEDFGFFGQDRKIPICMFYIGALDPQVVAKSQQEGKPLPSNHSPVFAPLPETSIRTGVKAMTSAVLDLMGK